MKNQYRIILFNLIMIALITSNWGCSSTGYERSEDATNSMQKMDNYIKNLVVHLDKMDASLSELTRSGQPDVEEAFEKFSDNVSDLEDLQSDFKKRSEKMKDNGNDYFEEWQKEGSKYKNQKIQNLSDQRREELNYLYQKIAQNSVGVADQLKIYVSNMKEIETYISNDMTPKGINAITPLSQKVVNDGNNIKYDIKGIQTAIEKVIVEMS